MAVRRQAQNIHPGRFGQLTELSTDTRVSPTNAPTKAANTWTHKHTNESSQHLYLRLDQHRESRHRYPSRPSLRPSLSPISKPVCKTKDVTTKFPINKDVNCAWVGKDADSNTINQCKKTSDNGPVWDQCPETCGEVGVGSGGDETDVKGNFQILKGYYDCAYVAKGSDNRTRGECRKTSGNSKVWDQCPVTCGEVGEGNCAFLKP
mmetsp:Transcript_10930/g.12049  ORF Transcript_10930/g.12049 Transcript_10930/m.12049 type:complete len:206 (+) Transcript_10930:165-782(+)